MPVTVKAQNKDRLDIDEITYYSYFTLYIKERENHVGMQKSLKGITMKDRRSHHPEGERVVDIHIWVQHVQDENNKRQ